MEEAVHSLRLVRFGTFEVDLRAGELRKGGVRLKLTGQPFQVLSILLERPGEVVTREDLQKRLWPDTFVDVDHNLNTAINKIREVLGDSAENPRFVETLPRRGYRFVAPVESAQTPEVPVGSGARQESRMPGGRPRLWVGALLAAIAVVAIAILAFQLTVPLPPPRVSHYVQVTNDGRVKAWPGRSFARLVTDGSRLYYVESPFVSPILKQVSTLGGETSAVDTPVLVNLIGDISPDRSSLFVPGYVGAEHDPPLWVLPLPTGTPHRVGELFGSDGTWFLDGKRIVFAKGHDFYVAKIDGTESKKLLSTPGYPYWPRWSPDGSRLRFSVRDPKARTSSLWEMQADGSHPHPLLPDWSVPPQDCCGSWTPDGKYFIFQSDHDGKTQIWAISEKGGLFRRVRWEPTELTTGPLSYAAPGPSIDGKRIFAIGSQLRGELGRFNQKTQQFEPYMSGISADGVDFSRDGQWVTYVSYPEGNLWRSKTDGSERLQLTFPPMRAFLPRWSPDQEQIVFTAQLPVRRDQNYLVSAHGGISQPVLPGEQPEEEDPNWSPDGISLVFWSSGTVKVLDLRTRKVSVVPGSDGFFSPHWSPEGRYIAARTADAQKLMLFDFTTQKWAELARVGVSYPNWSRDGNYVYFQSFGRDPALYRVRIRDHKLEKIVSLKGIRPTIGVAGTWCGLAPDDSPLVLRDVGTQEIYSLDLQLP